LICTAKPLFNRSCSHWGALLAYFFGDMILDVERRELRSGRKLITVEPQVFDILVFLIRNRDRVVSKDDLLTAVWDGRMVSESAIAARINAVRRAVGDDGEQQRWIRTVVRRGFRFVGDVREDAILETPSSSLEIATRQVPWHPSRGQEITFCRTKDGINLAVACVGQGVPLVSIPTWLTHLEYDWQNPGRAPLWRFLADRFRLIRYDGRGFGLSDRVVAEISLSTFERDLEAVVDALHLRRYALLGISQGVATAITHAVRYPDRVTRMAVIGGFALGRNKRGSTKEIELGKALIAVMRQGWVNENSAFLRMFSSVFIPGASPEQIKWYADLLRISTSAENAVRNHGGIDEIDIVDLLPKVSAPTLVLHSRHDNLVPFEEGRRLATSIPNATFVSLDSENHVPIPGEPAWPRFIGEIEAFLSKV
jgi:DNA-binding winged helix-turn-helix (wHTH) protein/pimeloyl-ACP methyl ester carboxylesterase